MMHLTTARLFRSIRQQTWCCEITEIASPLGLTAPRRVQCGHPSQALCTFPVRRIHVITKRAAP